MGNGALGWTVRPVPSYRSRASGAWRPTSLARGTLFEPCGLCGQNESLLTASSPPVSSGPRRLKWSSARVVTFTTASWLTTLPTAAVNIYLETEVKLGGSDLAVKSFAFNRVDFPMSALCPLMAQERRQSGHCKTSRLCHIPHQRGIRTGTSATDFWTSWLRGRLSSMGRSVFQKWPRLYHQCRPRDGS